METVSSMPEGYFATTFLGDLSELLVEAHREDPKGIDGRRGIADLVSALDEHLQLVAGDRRKGQPVGERRTEAHELDGDVHRRPADAQHLTNALEELVPGDRIRPTE